MRKVNESAVVDAAAAATWRNSTDSEKVAFVFPFLSLYLLTTLTFINAFWVYSNPALTVNWRRLPNSIVKLVQLKNLPSLTLTVS